MKSDLDKIKFAYLSIHLSKLIEVGTWTIFIYVASDTATFLAKVMSETWVSSLILPWPWNTCKWNWNVKTHLCAINFVAFVCVLGICFLQLFSKRKKFEQRSFLAKSRIYSFLKQRQMLITKQIGVKPNVHEPVRNSNEEFAIVLKGFANILILYFGFISTF